MIRDFMVLFCIALSGLMAVAQLIGNLQKRRVLLFAVFGATAYLLTYLEIFSKGKLYYFPEIFMSYVPSTIILTTSLYLFIQTSLEDKEIQRQNFKDWTPTFIGVGIFLFFFFVESAKKQLWIEQLYLGKNLLYFFPFTAFAAGASLVNLIRTYRLDPRYYSFQIKDRQGLVGFGLLAGMLLITLLSLATMYIPVALIVAKWGNLAIASLIITTSIFYFRFPNFMHAWMSDFKMNYQKRSYLARIDLLTATEKLRNLMASEKIYRDNALTLEKLAEKMGLTRYQLSELLNKELKVSFIRFLHGYRVEEAKALLIQFPHRTIISIAYEVGFNSVSSFQTAFKSVLGITPSECRE